MTEQPQNVALDEGDEYPDLAAGEPVEDDLGLDPETFYVDPDDPAGTDLPEPDKGPEELPEADDPEGGDQ